MKKFLFIFLLIPALARATSPGGTSVPPSGSITDINGDVWKFGTNTCCGGSLEVFKNGTDPTLPANQTFGDILRICFGATPSDPVLINLLADDHTNWYTWDGTSFSNNPIGTSPQCAAGNFLTVNAGDNLQTVINAASLGQTILITSGTTFTGNFTLPVKSGSTCLTIQSSNPPPVGVRVSPSSVGFAKLQTNNSSPVIATAASSHDYCLIGLELTTTASNTGDLITFGDGSASQNMLSLVPTRLSIERSYVHGNATSGTKRGVALNSAITTIKDSYFTDFKVVGQEAQAIGGWNGPGPYTITNNHLEGAGQGILFGGADTFITNLVPNNIIITNNFITRPLSWRSVWTVKNTLELKNAQNVTITGNVLENSWADGQTGYCIVLTVRNQDNTNNWATIQNV